MKKISSSKKSIKKYNRTGMHANIISETCYSHRKNMGNALSGDFLPYIISALIVFNMERFGQMGKGSQKFDKSEKGGFANNLWRVLTKHRKKFLDLGKFSIDNINIDKYKNDIEKIYADLEDLAIKSKLVKNNKKFHVGATKVLHFIHPELFPIVDSYCAKFLRGLGDEFRVKYNKSGDNHSKEKYIESMKAVQKFVNHYGVETFKSWEPCTPITRIFDKLAFVTAKEAEKAQKK